MNTTFLPKISVIVPVYNVEPYLCQCIDSIISQTYTNLEIILVDDGSPDNCGSICDTYAENDDRVVVIHKQNGGLSDARNAGIDVATGDYITFIDSDDWIDADMIEMLYNNLINYNADIACCGLYFVYRNKIVSSSKRKDIAVICSPEQAIKSLLLNNIPSVSAYRKLYKKYIFNNIRYPLNKRSEDVFIIVDVLLQANKIVYNYTPKYYYRKRKNSMSNSTTYNSNVLDEIDAYEHILCAVEHKHPELIDICEYRLIMSKINVFRKIISYKGYKSLPEYNSLLLYLRRNCYFIIGNNYTSKIIKVKIIALKISVNLYKVIQVLTECIKGDYFYKRFD